MTPYVITLLGIVTLFVILVQVHSECRVDDESGITFAEEDPRKCNKCKKIWKWINRKCVGHGMLFCWLVIVLLISF